MRMRPRDGMSWGSCREAAVVRPHAETDDLQLPFSDPTPQRYELIRPLLLDPARTATQRAQETGTHPETVGRLKRLFDQQGMLGLVPTPWTSAPRAASSGCLTPWCTNSSGSKDSMRVSAPANWLGSFFIPPCIA